MKILVPLFAVGLLTTAASALAQSSATGTLTGHVVEKKTGEPLVGANVVLLGTVLGTATDAEGRFEIRAVPPGSYSVQVTMVGYKAETKTGIVIRSGEATSLDLRLEETVLETPAVVVTASKRQQSAQESPVSVSVVTMTDLAQRPTFTIDPVLQYSPGVTITGSQVNIRGSTGYNRGAGSRVLLLLDGNPAMTGDAGTINWDALPTTEVERVEVVKGAGSALYGSNALGGVINVITREPGQTPETRLRVLAGSYDKPFYDQWRWTDRWLRFNGQDVSHSRRIGKLGILLSAGRKESTGYRENGQFKRWNAMGKFRYQFSTQSHGSLFINWATEDHGEVILWKVDPQTGRFSPFEVSDDALGNRIVSDKLNGHITFRGLATERLAYTLKAHYYWTGWQNHFRDNRDFSRTHKGGVEVQAEYVPHRQHTVTSGIELIYDRVRSNIFGRTSAGSPYTFDGAVYAQDEMKLAPTLLLTLGGRLDYHRVKRTFSESQWSPKAGVVYRPNGETTVRASVGRGFRAASIAEIFTTTTTGGFRVNPNLNLRAERAWSYELGWNQILGATALFDVALFQNDYWNFIDPRLDSVGTTYAYISFANLVRARIRGTELSLRTNWWKRRINAAVSYTFLDAKKLRFDPEAEIPCIGAFNQPDVTYHHTRELEYRPRHMVQASATATYRRLQLGADFRYLSRYREVKIFCRDTRVSQKVLDLRGGVELNRTISLLFRVENLLQYHYTETERNMAAPRNFTFSLSAKL